MIETMLFKALGWKKTKILLCVFRAIVGVCGLLAYGWTMHWIGVEHGKVEVVCPASKTR